MTATNHVQPDAAKREAILAQAIQVFADEGFRRADVQVIADRAGVGKGTVYRYFGNKQDLFWATSFKVTELLERHFFAAIAGVEGALAKLQAACLAYADFFEANPKCLEVFVQERAEFRGHVPDALRQYHNKLIDHFSEVLRQGIAAGECPAVDVRKTIFSLANALYGSVVHTCYHKGEPALTDLTRHVVEIFLRGLRAERPTSGKGN